VQAADGVLVNPHAWLLLVVEDQHAGALQVAVQGEAANLVRLIAALEQLQGEEPPRLPRQFSEPREIVEPSVVEGERLGFERRSFVPNLLPQVQHPFLNGVDGQLAAINANPTPAKLLGDGTRCARAGERVKNHIAFRGGQFNDLVQQSFVLFGRVVHAVVVDPHSRPDSVTETSVCRRPPVLWRPIIRTLPNEFERRACVSPVLQQGPTPAF
jgi:hypothetical protein